MSIKEENLIQYSGAIKAGQRLVKVGNTFMPVGIGGAFEPGSGGGGSMKFYKCASVDTANKTWSGYELILMDGAYSVSDVVTEGLSYSAVMPVIGSFYSADALLKIGNYYSGKIPEEGLVWYASLNSGLSDIATTGITESGHTMSSLPSGWSFTEHESIPCLYLDGHNDGRWTSTDSTNLPMQTTERTISFWVKIIRGTSDTNGGSNDYPYKYNQCGIIGYGIHNTYSTGNFYDVVIDTVTAQYCTKGCIAIHSYSYGAGSFYAKKETDWFSKWCHVAITNRFSGTGVYSNFYLNGEFVESYSWDEGKSGGVPTSFNRLSIGNKNNTSTNDYGNLAWEGYLAGVRIYDKVLPPEDITALANEYKPIAQDVPDIPNDELVGTPRGTRLMLRHIDLDPVWEEEFVQDDPTATGYDRTWTNVNPQGYDRIMYNPDYGGWNVFSNYGDPLYAGADREDPWGTDGFDGLAEIVVIE